MCVRAMGYQIKDKCVIISTLTCTHSRAVLLKKKLTNPLLQIIRRVHLSSVNKGKLPLKLQLSRWLYRRNSILGLSPAAGVPRPPERYERLFQAGRAISSSALCRQQCSPNMRHSTWCIRNPALLVYSKL